MNRSMPVSAVVLRRALMALSASLMALGCSADRGARNGDDSGATPSAADIAAAPTRFGLGTPATQTELAAIDIDVNPAGVGLPAGSGSYDDGARLYAMRCAVCHGVRGEGMAMFPRLVSSAADTGFRFGNDVRLVKTPGNYWPYATTLFDYIRRTMPHNAPGSLSPNEVYAVVAFLLAEDRVIPRTAVMSAQTLPAVRMPARDRFVPDNRTGGPTFR